MKSLIILGVWLLAGMARAADWADTLSFSNAPVVVSNSQVNSSWAPIAALVRFEGATCPTPTITRLSGGLHFPLRTRVATHITALIWIPETAFPFAAGDAIHFDFGQAATGSIQLIKRGE